MTKQPFTTTKLTLTALSVSLVILIMAMFMSMHVGSNNQLPLYKTLHTKSDIIDQKTEEVNNEKALYLNGSNNEMNEFMIDEFKKIYRVNA